MNAHIVSSGYCGLLDAVIAKAYPQAVRDKEITYEAGYLMNTAPQVIFVSKSASPSASNPIGFAELDLFDLNSRAIIPERDGNGRVIWVGLSLILEMNHQKIESTCLITQEELLDALRQNGWEPIRYAFSIASNQRSYLYGNSVRTLLVTSHASLPSKERIRPFGRGDDVLSAFFQIMRESEWMSFHLREFFRKVLSVSELN